jgi:hypothetical protein
VFTGRVSNHTRVADQQMVKIDHISAVVSGSRT